MNTRKELKLFLENWNKYYSKSQINEALGDVDYAEFLGKIPQKVADHYRKVAASYFIFDKESFDIDEQTKIKKELVEKVLTKNGFKGFPKDHIYVASNIAEREYQTGEIKKGTAGKSTPAEQIASERPDASGYIVYDNLSRGLGEIEKGLARHAKGTNPELKAKIERMAQLSKTSVEYKKLDAEVKAALARINIQTMKVGESGEATEMHGAVASKTDMETKSGLRGWREVRNLVYQTLLKGTGALLKGNHPQFKKIIGKYPHLAYAYNDMEKYTSSDTDMKKATALSAEESPELSTVKDVRTIYIAPLLKLEEQGKDLAAAVRALSSARDDAGAVEREQELSDLKREMNKIGADLWPFISKVKKELVACLDEMKDVKSGESFLFKLGQQDAVAPEGGEAQAAPPTLDPADKSVIKIFDFDGTLFNTTEFFSQSGISNLFAVNFYMTYLKPSIKRTFMAKIGDNVQPMSLAAELKADPANTYIVTTVASGGVDKRVDYFAHLFQKKDETLVKFLQFMNQHRGDKGAKSAEETYAEIYPKWITAADEPQATPAAEPQKAATEKPAAAAQAPAAASATGAPKYPSREDFRKNTAVAKAYKKWAYEKGTEDDQMGYEADRDDALDDNEDDRIDEASCRKIKTLKEQLAGLKFRLGTRR